MAMTMDQKRKNKNSRGPSMVRRWRTRTSAIRERPIGNRAVTSKADHDMKVEDFIPLWRSWLIQYRKHCRSVNPTLGPMVGYKPAQIFNFDQVPFGVDRMFKKQNCSKGAKFNKLMRLSATVDPEKKFCTPRLEFQKNQLKFP